MGTLSLNDLFVVGFTGTFSVWHWLIVLVVVLILFGGGGKIPKLMKDLGSGVNQFKKGLKEEEESAASGDDANKALESKDAEVAVKRSSEDEEKTAANG